VRRRPPAARPFPRCFSPSARPPSRPQEFGPADLTPLVVAVADMHVGDAELGESAAAAVAVRRAEYSPEQLEAVRDALERMGCGQGTMELLAAGGGDAGGGQ
jgi:hypothetical protein